MALTPAILHFFGYAGVTTSCGSRQALFLGAANFSLLEVAGAVAMALGVVGFGGFVGGAGALAVESRYALLSLKKETDEALAGLRRAD